VNSTSSRLRSKPGTRIVHLAANTSVQESIRRPLLTVRANIEATCRMLDFARKIDCERFLFASTAAIYGDKSSRCRETDTQHLPHLTLPPSSPPSTIAGSTRVCTAFPLLFLGISMSMAQDNQTVMQESSPVLSGGRTWETSDNFR